MQPQGLTAQEVLKRRANGQGNNAKLPTSRSYWQIFRENLLTFINFVFFTLSLLMFALKRYGDAFLVVVIISTGVIISIVQEIWAKRKLDEIALLSRPKATVIRDGQAQDITPEEIVLGDLIVLEAGDQILVDGHMVGEGRVEVDESLLTGESDLVPKNHGDEVFSGSNCVSGSAYFEATKVGSDTVAYKLVTGARTFRQVYTPLQQEINLIIRALLLLACFLLLLVAISYFSRSYSFGDIVQHAAVVAGIVPTGLLIAITLAYGTAAVRMLSEDILIQQTNAVESLSNVDVLCLDKTGTLTTNQINLQTTYPIGISDQELRQHLGNYAVTTNSPNRTIEALQTSCHGKYLNITAEVPFSSARKWSAIVHDVTYVLGAPEMMAKCVTFTPEMAAQIEAGLHQGLRVLLFAQTSDTHWHQVDDPNHLCLPKLEPLGILHFSDQLRTNVAETLAEFTRAGIELKVISGDNPDTVAALAKQAGFGDVGVVSGLELSEKNGLDFAQAAATASIFGRITPDQKAELVKALRTQDKYVAMIGDGVNDVLSLKQSNLGIAMESGSKATRAVADIILLNDSFSALPRAFIEGQRIRNGIRDSLALFLVRVTTVTLLIFAIAMVTESFPLINKHSALLALFGVGLPTGVFPLWAKPGKQRHKTSVVQSLLHFTIPASITMTLVSLFVYLLYLVKAVLELPGGDDITQIDYTLPRTALVTILILCHLVLLPFLKPPHDSCGGGEPYSGDWRYTIAAIVLTTGLMLILVIPPVRQFYELAALSLRDIGFLLLVALEWALILRLTWRMKFFDRFLGVDLLRR
ncbi:HAD-IC family P-type ATPase [filamentous cyanobacterium LEGE 11480]|uniref:HAD-IC family P-type ATPase n=1 Tax=Romeriopsis navalis LEGE 11480 TaxID=2777977 RepID=A0A928Z523_9CYAN|nr:HAD-IC family P-type ATPase [Romeriopsis navalis]MBE9030800.1 HAD-IC family P-type ATPase [Romeriopsis navalis LEGE 11480]